MIHILFSILAFISTILIVVSVHEFGHFIVAKFCKIKVLRFSIGFGKVLWRFYDKQKTEYAISAVPLGGYVRLLDENEGPVAPEERSQTFNYHPLHQRFAVIIAGVLFNIIFAFLAFWLVFSVGIVFIKPLVGGVMPNSLAAEAGIKAGEEIIAINNKSTPHWSAIAMTLIEYYGEEKTVAITVREISKNKIIQHQINLDLRHWHLNALRPDPLSSLGIVPYQFSKPITIAQRTQMLNTMRYPFFKAAMVAYQQMVSFIHFNWVILTKMLTGVISWKSLGGPLTIFQAAVLSAGQGLIIYINFLALLSVSIAVVNLFPIPGLDGAQLVYLLIEMIRGKAVSLQAQVLLFRLGVIVLVLLMIQVLMNDLLRLIL